MFRRTLLTLLATFVALQAIEAFAQQSNASSYYLTTRNRQIRRASNSSYFVNRSSTNSVFNRAAPRYDYSSVGRNLFNQVREKPFSGNNVSSGVSPYLGLGGINVGSVPNYYSVVRPQLEQQRINERAQQQQISQQRELTALSARSPYAATEETTPMLPTGHVSAFMNYFGYYPQPAQPRQR